MNVNPERLEMNGKEVIALSKKFAAVIVAAVLLLNCAACGGKQSAKGPYSVEGVLFDAEGVTVTATGWTVDPTEEPESPIIGLEIRNAGKKDLCLGVENGSVNGFMNDLNLIEFYVDENGQYYGGSYAFSLMIPANGGGDYALGFNRATLSMAGIETISEITLTFTVAENDFTAPYYKTEPITIETGNAAEAVSLDAFGVVALDNDVLQLVLGEQEYDNFFGPTIYAYVWNKTERFLGLSIANANADGNECDYNYYFPVVAPGKYSADIMSFDSPIREMKGIENLTLSFNIYQAEDADIMGGGATAVEPVSVTYPAREWGEYENGGLRLEIQPKYNELITVETPRNDADGILFSIAETASAEAGGYDGAGELLRIAKVDGKRLHEMLCEDMSGVSVFAKDGDGNFYLSYQPTDVRYERASVEEMRRDQDQWTMLTEWANDAPDELRDQNEGLETFYRGNTMLDMYLARAAYQDGARYTLGATEYGTLEPDGVDGAPYAEFLLDGGFFEVEDVEDLEGEVPDGESIVLSFPEENLSFDFFFSEGNVVRMTSGDSVTFYQTFLYDDDMTFTDVMRGWYYALAEKAGVREHDAVTDAFAGSWAEEIAGRGTITLSALLAPERLRVAASWPNSASEMYTWDMIAHLTDGNAFRYENGVRTITEFGEDGEGYTTDEREEQSGYFYLNDEGKLCWHDDQAEGSADSVFIRVD